MVMVVEGPQPHPTYLITPKKRGDERCSDMRNERGYEPKTTAPRMPVISPVSVSFAVSHWTADGRSATGPDVRSSNGDKIAHVFLVSVIE